MLRTTLIIVAFMVLMPAGQPGIAAPRDQQEPRSCQAVTPQMLAQVADRATGDFAIPANLAIVPDGDELRIQLAEQNAPMVYCIGFVEDGEVTGVIAAGPGTGQEAGSTVITLKVPNLRFGLPQRKQLVLLGFVPPSAGDDIDEPVAQAEDTVAADINLASEDQSPGSVAIWTPEVVLGRSVLVSDKSFSLLGALIAVGLFYLVAGLALRKDAHRAAFNPVYLTSGQFGKASLSQFQIFAFTLLVVGLLLFVVLRTGALTDISQDVLMLLGISAVGAGGSKLAAVAKRRLTLENWTWLRERGWLIAYEKNTGQKADPKKARWGDLLKSGDDFDIYKFQLVTVSAVVALALLTGDQSQLATFSIPPNLLALLGLSNVVYIGAKAVTPNSLKELNEKIDETRKAEKAMLAGAPQVGADEQGEAITAESQRAAYISAARDAAEMLRQIYGEDGTKFGDGRITDQKLLPQLS